MSNQRKKAQQERELKEASGTDISKIIFIAFIIGIVPLIVISKVVFFSDIEKVSLGEGPKLDIFSYYKMLVLLLCTAAGFLTYLVRRDTNPLDDNKKIYYIPAGIYILFVFFSAIASEYKNIAVWGYYGRYEGAFVLISYIIVLFLSMNLVKEDRPIKIVFTCLLSSSLVISAIGILQYFGINPVYDIAMATTPSYAKVTLSPSLGPKSVYSTLYNPNYVGSYMAMILPVSILLFTLVKKVLYKAALAALLCFTVISWIICDSRAGIVGGVISILVLVVMYRKKLFKHKWIIASIALLMCGGLVIFNFATNGSVIERLTRILSITSKDNAAENSGTLETVIKGLVDVSMNKDRAKIVTDKGTLQVVLLDGGKIKLIDENSKELDFSMDSNIITLNDERFSNIMCENKSQDGIMIVYYNDYKLIDIMFTDTGLMSRSNRWMPYRNDKAIETFGFKGMETYGSNRGYIWSRTLPLLKNTILLGHGPDTFPMYFPQYDYVGKLKYYLTGGILIDKPHDFYLQTAVNTGIISLLALIVLFGIYFVSSIKIYIKEEFSTFKSIAGLACFAAFCGYIVSAFFNDSTVSVAPVFWILFGTGIGINTSLIKDKRKNMLVKKPGKETVATVKESH